MIFCKYSKFMSEPKDTNKGMEKIEIKTQFSESGIFVREDDQDWGSSGMNNIKTGTE